MRIPSSLLLSSSLLVSAVGALNFDCKKIKVDGIKYDIGELKGVHSIYHAEDKGSYTINTTYVMNLCSNLGKASIRDGMKCGTTRNICGFEYNTTGENHKVTNKVSYPIVGLDHMGHGAKDPEIIRLKKDNPDEEGLRVKLGGGEYIDEAGKVKDARAVIQFQCDHDRSGLEGLSEAASSGNETQTVRVRDEDGGEDAPPGDDESNPERSLQFKSFGLEDDDMYVLRLDWKTRYACDNYVSDRDAEASGHWGFFTWLIIIFFLCVAAYLIFGSWLNYNRYGARGWDLLPHGDTIRDIPYLFSDWLRRVINTLQGTGSRGGYSAV